MRNKSFEEHIAQHFKRHSSTPPDAVWAAIEADLTPNKKRRGLIFWWLTAAGVCLGLLLWTSNGKSVEDKTTISQQQEDTSPRETSTEEKQLLHTAKSNNHDSKEAMSNGSSPQDLQRTSLPLQQAVSPKLDDNQNNQPHLVPHENSGIKTQHRQEQNKQLLALSTTPIAHIEHALQLSPTFVPHRSIKERRWEIGIHAQSFNQVGRSKKIYEPDEDYTNNSDPQPVSSIVTSDSTATYHKRQFEVEVFGRLNLNNSWSVGAGLFTSLHDDDILSDSISKNSNRWILGVPIHLRYTLLRKGRFSLTGELSAINEFARFTTQSTVTAPPSSSPILANVDLTESNDARSFYYGVAINPSLELGYDLNDRLALHALAGYRNYLFQTYTNPTIDGIRAGNYLNFGVGLTYQLRTKLIKQ